MRMEGRLWGRPVCVEWAEGRPAGDHELLELAALAVPDFDSSPEHFLAEAGSWLDPGSVCITEACEGNAADRVRVPA